jgi:2-polyprenyl-3-methyl-5-hydroxy-6-metoxy-1,4-benzoquinol methylase
MSRPLVPAKSDTPADVELDVPIQFRKGLLFRDQNASVASAVSMIGRIITELGVADLSDTAILDIGCGVKFTQAFYGRKIPVKRYHGVDVGFAMIKFLKDNVADERFSYKYIKVYNARYHRRGGEPLSADIDIGAKKQVFDLVCLFSVFTHLDPADYQAMLRLARKYISFDGTFIFTTFIDDSIDGDFIDKNPELPMHMAVYRENIVRKFAVEASWSIRNLFQFGKGQHWVICKPE